MDERGFIYFVDRIGDTFRWKGENVSASEVELTLSSCPGVLDVIVYGVSVPGAEGRAGMAAVATDDRFDLRTFHSFAKERLPTYARPMFVRLCNSLEMTDTFKPKKQMLVREGFDPSHVTDPIYMADVKRDAYVPVDEATFRNMQTRLT
jgi:fatty-acyl-CoA synthase